MSMVIMIVMKKNTLAVRAFPPELNKMAKIKAVQLGISLRQFIIDAVTKAVNS
jgi:predicted HicB family RNase H-like nuclease